MVGAIPRNSGGRCSDRCQGLEGGKLDVDLRHAVYDGEDGEVGVCRHVRREGRVQFEEFGGGEARLAKAGVVRDVSGDGQRPRPGGDGDGNSSRLCEDSLRRLLARPSRRAQKIRRRPDGRVPRKGKLRLGRKDVDGPLAITAVGLVVDESRLGVVELAGDELLLRLRGSELCGGGEEDDGERVTGEGGGREDVCRDVVEILGHLCGSEVKSL